MRKVMLIAIGVIVVMGASLYAAYKLSPWPSVLMIRYAFDQGAEEAKASAAPLVPEGVSARYGLAYLPGDEDAKFDLFAPESAAAPLPAVVWVHGGGFIAGSRADLAGYLQVLAARGYVVMAIDYTPAPEAQFPTPVEQTNAALAYLAANAAQLNVDPSRIFLAGDSAGAQISAQTALAIAEPAYAHKIDVTPGLPRKSLRGVVLFCGPYDPRALNFEGAYGDFMRTVIWSYVGTRDPADPRVAQMGVTPYVTSTYPPTFISVGNADPLAPQSYAFAEALRAKGVEVDALFFDADHRPPLEHEYQLLLSTDDGQRAFDRYTAFLAAHSDRGGGSGTSSMITQP